MPEAAIAPDVEPERKCQNCPSFLSASKAPLKFGKSVNADMCGRFGIVLSRPEMTEKEIENIGSMIGSRCDSYGVEVGTGAAEQFAPTVAMPKAPIAARANTLRPGNIRAGSKTTSTGSCMNCINYITERDVVNDFGWTAGMCAVKGKLIPVDRVREFATGCEYAVKREPDTDTTKTDSIDLLKWYKYSEEVVASTDSIALVERAVTAAEKTFGIDSWIKVEDGNGKGKTFLPHFSPDTFSALERALIPCSGDDEHPELYKDHGNVIYRIVVSWVELGETPITWGPAGVGKTEIARHLAYLMGLPFYRFSITASTELDDLAGKILYTPEKGTYFQYGRLSTAWQRPGIILLDEPNTAPPDVWQFLRPLTDNSKQMVLDINDGERITRDKYSFMILAANPSYDPRNVGANTIGDADGSRLMHIKMELPEPDLEMEIIKARVNLDKWSLNDVQRRMITAIAKDVRAMVADDTLPITWGIRNQIKVARSLKWFDPITAYRIATDNLEPESQKLILDSVRSHAPVEKAVTSPYGGGKKSSSPSSLRDREASRAGITVAPTTSTRFTGAAPVTGPPVGIRKRP